MINGKTAVFDRLRIGSNVMKTQRRCPLVFWSRDSPHLYFRGSSTLLLLMGEDGNVFPWRYENTLPTLLGKRCVKAELWNCLISYLIPHIMYFNLLCATVSIWLTFSSGGGGRESGITPSIVTPGHEVSRGYIEEEGENSIWNCFFVCVTLPFFLWHVSLIWEGV